IDGIAFQILIVAVDAVAQLFGTQDGVRFAEQGTQQGELTSRQTDWLAVQGDMAGGGTETESPIFNAICFVARHTSCQYMQACQQLVQVKRFDDIVIAPTQQPFNPVMQGVASRQNQNGQFTA